MLSFCSLQQHTVCTHVFLTGIALRPLLGEAGTCLGRVCCVRNYPYPTSDMADPDSAMLDLAPPAASHSVMLLAGKNRLSKLPERASPGYRPDPRVIAARLFFPLTFFPFNFFSLSFFSLSFFSRWIMVTRCGTRQRRPTTFTD